MIEILNHVVKRSCTRFCLKLPSFQPIIMQNMLKKAGDSFIPDKNEKISATTSTNLRFFRWYFVFDIEATCDQNRYLQPPQEIIEFPVVVYDARLEKTIAQFHSFVRPTEHPLLSSFCTNLTGINQKVVDKSEPLANVLNQFTSWLNKVKSDLSCNFKEPNASAVFVTWTDADISEYLWEECRRKKIAFPSDMLNRIDVKENYKRWFFSQRRGHYFKHGLSNALNSAGLTMIGSSHSGIDDAKNTIRLLAFLLKSGTN